MKKFEVGYIINSVHQIKTLVEDNETLEPHQWEKLQSEILTLTNDILERQSIKSLLKHFGKFVTAVQELDNIDTKFRRILTPLHNIAQDFDSELTMLTDEF